TADVELERADDVGVIQMTHYVREVFGPAADDVHDHARALHVLGEPRQIISLHRLDAGIREPHGVEHSPFELRDARRQVAAAWLQADGFRDDAAECIEIHDTVERAAECSGSGCKDDRVLELYTSCRHPKVGHLAVLPPPTRASYLSMYAIIDFAIDRAIFRSLSGSLMYAASDLLVPNPISTSTAGMNAPRRTAKLAC